MNSPSDDSLWLALMYTYIDGFVRLKCSISQGTRDSTARTHAQFHSISYRNQRQVKLKHAHVHERDDGGGVCDGQEASHSNYEFECLTYPDVSVEPPSIITGVRVVASSLNRVPSNLMISCWPAPIVTIACISMWIVCQSLYIMAQMSFFLVFYQPLLSHRKPDWRRRFWFPQTILRTQAQSASPREISSRAG